MYLSLLDGSYDQICFLYLYLKAVSQGTLSRCRECFVWFYGDGMCWIDAAHSVYPLPIMVVSLMESDCIAQVGMLINHIR